METCCSSDAENNARCSSRLSWRLFEQLKSISIELYQIELIVGLHHWEVDDMLRWWLSIHQPDWLVVLRGRICCTDIA
jgi:hypothetical protein